MRKPHRLGDGDLETLLLGDREALRLRLCLLTHMRGVNAFDFTKNLLHVKTKQVAAEVRL